MTRLDAIIHDLKTHEDREQRAYNYNELGMFLGKVGDDRCIDCFENACRLTQSPGNKMRLLGRIGDAYLLILQDWDRAARFYRACIAVGERHSCNPLHVMEARFRLSDLEADRRGESRAFDEMRGTIILNADSCASLTRNLKIPGVSPQAT